MPPALNVRLHINRASRGDEMTNPIKPPTDPISEGARARAQGRPKDACPYPANSSEREAWMEGYDGAPAGKASDLPMDNG